MPTYMKGNMWSALESVDHFIITTNAIVKVNGGLVMGAGIAKQVRDANPGIDVILGKAVEEHRKEGGHYGCLLKLKDQLGIFQVKYHYMDQADLDLIEYSTSRLRAHALTNKDETYALNFPGIGNGKLSYDAVKPIVDTLPDNIQVWTFN